MIKRIFAVFVFSLFLSANAGEFEDALVRNENVFLYLYTADCNICTQFDEKYKKLIKTYGNNYGFVKVDADKPYGRMLLSSFRGRYVPFIALVSEKRGIATRMEPECIMDMACLEKSMKEFQYHKKQERK